MQNESHKPRHERRFPYVALTDDERVGVEADITAAIAGFDRFIIARLAKRIGRGDASVDDLAQKVRLHLALVSIPKYDTTKPAKLTTYLMPCVINKINEVVRTEARKRQSKRALRLFTDFPNLRAAMTGGYEPSGRWTPPAAKDEFLDDRIAAIAQSVFSHPEKYLSAAQAKVFKAIVENPNVMMKDLAVSLGYERPSSLSMMMRRIRERILEIDIEGWDSGEVVRKVAA